MEPSASQRSQYPTCRPFCIISGREGSGPKHQNSTTRSTELKNLVCAFIGYIGSIVPHHYLPIRPPPHAQMMMFGPNCRSKWQKYECGLNIERLRTTFWCTRPGYIGANAIHTTIDDCGAENTGGIATFLWSGRFLRRRRWKRC